MIARRLALGCSLFVVIRQTLKRRASSATGVDTVRIGGQCARITPANEASRAAVMTSMSSTSLLCEEIVGRCVELARSRGYEELRTGALGLLEQGVYIRAGFEPRSELRLLGAPTRRLRVPPSHGWQYATCRYDMLGRLAETDQAAFGEDTGLGLAMLQEVISATPRAVVRAAFDGAGVLAGYAVFGSASAIGYVQRLAVIPSARRSGAGRGLLGEGVAWMTSKAAERVFVNTELANTAALNLYRSCGFEDQPAVLSTLAFRLR